MLPRFATALRHFRPLHHPLQALRQVAAWPGRRLVALLAVPLPPHALRPRAIDRALQRRNVRYHIGPDVHALTQSLSPN